MLILLPPSEGKFCPQRGQPLDLDSLAFPGLTSTRRTVLTSLTTLSRGDAEVARTTLGLTPGLASEVARNAQLYTACATPARRVYTGVLYEALGFETLSLAARRRAASRVLITSAAFGLVRPHDRIPAYRLSGDVTLPEVGTVASAWREVLGDVLVPATRRHLLVDLRSDTYATFWRPPADIASRVVTVRVLHEVDGRRSVVSHFNKATKGRLVRALLDDGRDARNGHELAALIEELGWRVDVAPDGRSVRPSRLDVVVTDL